MTPERQSRWSAALRSGEYPQATGRLKTDDGYCCLGVECVLNGEEFVKGADGRWKTQSGLTGYWSDDEYREEAGVSWNVMADLVNMNDHGGKTFSEIADWIDAHDLETGALLEPAP